MNPLKRVLPDPRNEIIHEISTQVGTVSLQSEEGVVIKFSDGNAHLECMDNGRVVTLLR